ncbi:hypothetical protein CPLU01_09692 [Colletotrichum plurivorum]|uniref:Uncharacterized protein n=1 Tax=Colletotrichum plurivorum TaxID=2175906 RepID=A0A8H6K7D5_9PEZI|nr:hypothetical protein CPLU01_09692 [Colletotrichum plurivorum]
MPFDFDQYYIECASLSAAALQKEWEKYTRQIASGSTSTALSTLAAPFTGGLSLVGVALGAGQIHNAPKKRDIIEKHLGRHQESARTRCRDVVFGTTLSGAVFVATLGTTSVLPLGECLAEQGGECLAEQGGECLVEQVVEKVVVHGAFDVAAENVDEECAKK